MSSKQRKQQVNAATSVRAWQRMLSGRRLDLLNPSPLDIEIEDIAHGLARVARWNGQTIGNHAFSVAQHSLLVLAISENLKQNLELKWKLAILLHDAPEYVIGDLISPFKAVIGLDYKTIEYRLLEAIHIRFGLPPELPKLIQDLTKRSDHIAAYFEATCLAGFTISEAKKYFGTPRSLSAESVAHLQKIQPWPASRAQSEFMRKFRLLQRRDT